MVVITANLFFRGIFTDEYKKTIGVDFLERVLHVDSLGQDVRLMVWDTAGQEEFDSITRTYFRGNRTLGSGDTTVCGMNSEAYRVG